MNSSHKASTCQRILAFEAFASGQEQWPEFSFYEMNNRNVIVELHEIFAKLTQSEITGLRKPLNTNCLQKAAQNVTEIFVPDTHTDAHEFLMSLLNCIRDCSDYLMVLIQNVPLLFEK